MRKTATLGVLILVFGIMALYSYTTKNQTNKPINEEPMNSYIAIVEIPVIDTDRAREFYEKVMGLTLEQHKMPGMEMALFPYENQQVAIVLLKSEGYRPSAQGTTIYLNTGKDLQPILDRASKLGGQILMPKTAHADGSGFFALFLDSEGNRIGLHSTH